MLKEIEFFEFEDGPLFEKGVMIPLQNNADLIRVIESLGHWYLNVGEEGTAKIYSDLENFPPTNIPNTDNQDFKLTGIGPYLTRNQAKVLKPTIKYGRKNFYLLAETHGDCDQLLASTRDVYYLNNNFKIITYCLGPQDSGNFRQPEVIVYIVRGKSARISFSMIESNISGDYANAQSGMRKVLTGARNKFMKIFESIAPGYNSLSELYAR